jgi:hypothetical protein
MRVRGQIYLFMRNGIPSNQKLCSFVEATGEIMSYADVDKILPPWLKRHGLHVSTMYREEEVRIIDIVDDAGDRYSVAISEPDASEKVRVFVANFTRKRKRKSCEFETNLSDLARVLEEAYSKIMEWLSQEGHTRTPVL